MTAPKFRHLQFDQLGSTNAEARRQAEAGEGGPLWITARTQTAGRGRRGRDWVSEPGNLFATLLINLPVPPATATQISFVTALAIYDSCVSMLSTGKQLTLKWPNDVLLDNKKLAGILLETVPCNEPGKIALAIGCGVNLLHAPDQTAYGATWLSAHAGQTISPGQFLNKLAPTMKGWLNVWQNGQSFDQIAKAWQERASHIGKIISLASGNQTITGKFLALAHDGALILELADGRQKHYHAGDVSFHTQTNPGSSNAE